MQHPGKRFHIPIGNCMIVDCPPLCMITEIPCTFPQGQYSFCMTYALAAALKHIGFNDTKIHPIMKLRVDIRELPMVDALNEVIKVMRCNKFKPFDCRKYNLRRNKKKKIMSFYICDLFREYFINILLIQPISEWGKSDHMIAVMQDL